MLALAAYECKRSAMQIRQHVTGGSMSFTAQSHQTRVWSCSFWGAAGGEFRNNPHEYPEPFGIIIEKPEAIVPVFHLLNTQNTTQHDGRADQGEYSKLLECPCTSMRHFNLTNNTIDGCQPSPKFQCNAFFEASKNPACHLSTYIGGYRCCENGVFLSESPVSAPPATVYGKMTFTYAKANKESRRLFQTDCCDVTASADQGFANIEYTVPKCAAGTPPDRCVHVVTNVQELHASVDPDVLIDLVYAAGHAHTGALRLDLVDEETSQLMCEADIRYGTSAKPGDESGYLTGIYPCVWGPPPLPSPPRLRAGHMLRTIVHYNSSVQHNGVMSLWLMAGSPVTPGFLIKLQRELRIFE